MGLEETARALHEARKQQREAKKTIEQLQPEYERLLLAKFGKGKVEFTYDGYKYGRIMVETAKFDLERFQKECPRISAQVVVSHMTHELDEELLKEYLDEHPEAKKVIEEYVTLEEVGRWKPPVPVKE